MFSHRSVTLTRDDRVAKLSRQLLEEADQKAGSVASKKDETPSSNRDNHTVMWQTASGLSSESEIPEVTRSQHATLEKAATEPRRIRKSQERKGSALNSVK